MSGQGIQNLTVYMTATGAAVNGPCMFRGMDGVSGAINGDIILRDGGAGGTIKYQRASPGANGVSFNSMFSGEGIKFTTDLYVSLPVGTRVTIYYDTGTP